MWQCKQCETLNSDNDAVCIICKSSRVEQEHLAPASRIGPTKAPAISAPPKRQEESPVRVDLKYTDGRLFADEEKDKGEDITTEEKTITSSRALGIYFLVIGLLILGLFLLCKDHINDTHPTNEPSPTVQVEATLVQFTMPTYTLKPTPKPTPIQPQAVSREQASQMQYRISAAGQHVVGLKANGTVVALGRNDVAQCRVSGWQDIVAVSAGPFFTVGLKKDGTVVATGWNEYGQCDVSDWQDIVSVSAGYRHTVGLKKDGTVVVTDADCVDDWTNIVAVSAGSEHTVGLKADGTVVAVGYNEYGQCDVSGWTDIVAVSAGDCYTVGLKADGTVVAAGYNADGQCEVSGWTDIVAVSTDYYRTVGLKADGTVVAVGDNDYGECDVSGWTDIVAVSTNWYNTIGLKKDGTVVAVGFDDYHLHDMCDWNLFDSSAVSVTPEPTIAPTPKPTPTLTTLERGDTGEAVRELQRALIERNFLYDVADGSYGAKTEEAIKEVQRMAGLEVTGIADHKTQIALSKLTAPYEPISENMLKIYFVEMDQSREEIVIHMKNMGKTTITGYYYVVYQCNSSKQSIGNFHGYRNDEKTSYWSNWWRDDTSIEPGDTFATKISIKNGYTFTSSEGKTYTCIIFSDAKYARIVLKTFTNEKGTVYNADGTNMYCTIK